MNFYDLELRSQMVPILKDDKGISLMASDLKKLNDIIRGSLPKRSVVFFFGERERIPVGVYLGLLKNKVVPVFLPVDLDTELIKALFQIYQPDFIFIRESMLKASLNYPVIQRIEDYVILRTGFRYFHKLHDDLALLLPTLAHAGDTRLVRYSYRNLEACASAVADGLELSPADRPLMALPVHRACGLSLLNSYLHAGATVLLTEKSLAEKEFWDFLMETGASTLVGEAQIAFELEEVDFFSGEMPDLKGITIAGGQLSEQEQHELAQYAARTGRKFIRLYAQMEATAHMAYLPPQKALEKKGYIGIPIPEGKFELLDAEENVITQPNTAGELVYYGKNVSLGYAERAEDFNKGDERKGCLLTGNMALRDADGYYKLLGRKSEDEKR